MKRLTIRLDGHLLEQVHTLAEMQGKSVNQVVVDVLEGYVRDAATDPRFHDRLRSLIEAKMRVFEAFMHGAEGGGDDGGGKG